MLFVELIVIKLSNITSGNDAFDSSSKTTDVPALFGLPRSAAESHELGMPVPRTGRVTTAILFLQLRDGLLADLPEDGVKVEPFDELPAAPYADLLKDIGEMILDRVLGDVE